MKKYRGSAFAVSISFILLFSISLFLYSCGQNNPTGGTLSGNSQKQIPAKSPIIAPLILLTASSTANDNITIKLTGEAGKVYHLYMTDNINAQASTSTHLPDSNTYTLTLDPTKTYYFILGVIGTNGKERPSGAYVTSKPSVNGQYRENIVTNPQNNTESQQIKQTAANSSSGLNAYQNLTGGSGLSVRFNDWGESSMGSTMEQLDFYVSDYSLHVAEPTGGHFVRGRFGANLLGRIGGHPEVVQCHDVDGNIVANCYNWLYKWYSPLVAGYWDYDDEKYKNYHAKGTFSVSLLYSAPPEPYFSFYGTPRFIYRVSTCGGEALAEGAILLQADGDYMTPPIVVTAPAQCPGDTPPDRILTSILAEPAQATIYIHPRNPASASQQYKATGTFNDGTTEVITNNVLWHSSKPDIATIDSTALAALPAPISLAKPGSTAIWATSTMTANPAFPLPSNGAELCVDCWEVTHIRQNKHVPSTDPYTAAPTENWVNVPYARIWTRIYKIDPNTGRIMIDDKGKWVIAYVTDAGPRSNYPLQPGESIGDVGCHLVSATMILTTITGKFVNPKKLNKWLNDHVPMGYDEENGPKWPLIQEYTDPVLGISSSNIIGSWEHAFEIVNPKNNQITWTKEQSYAIINGALDNCNMVVLHVRHNNGVNFPSHYVVAVKNEKGDYQIYDPWYFSGEYQKLEKLTDRYNITGFNIIRVRQ